jgi:peptidoglycan/LPS O-acetylase OafA/YrhL
VRGGFTGVDIFFVISGYLITGLLLLDIKQYRRIRILHFYARRVRRILPMLLLVVLTTELASILLLSPALRETQRISHEAIATLLASANFFFLRAGENYFSVRSDFEPLLHTWSLAVEEQFYLLWPAMLAAAYAISARTRSPGFWLGVTMGALCAGSFACAVLLSRWREDWTFYLTAARGWELGAGGLLAITLPSVRGVPRSWGLTASVVGLALIAAGVAFLPAEHSSPLLLFVFPVLGTSLVIGGNMVHPAGPVGRLLSWHALVQIGLVSYGWYLWHWPALSLVRILGLGSHDLVRDCAISVATLTLSFVTLRWYERPLRSGAGIRGVASGWIVVTGCGATVAAVALVFGVNAWSDHRPRTAAEIALFRAKDDGDTKCLLPLGSDETVAPANCLASGDLPRVVL